MERRSGSDRRVADRRQGSERAAPFHAFLAPEFGQAKTTPIEGTTVLNVENASRLLKPAWFEANRFFAKDITELEVPDSFCKTEERLREIGFTRAEPLVLPQWTLRKNDPLWERGVKPGTQLWEQIKGGVKPDLWFWEELKNGNLHPESAILQKGVYLIDGRNKPDYQDGEQKYEDDGFMEKMIKELRRKGKIQRHRYVPEDSRFAVSPVEIEEVILPELARMIGKEALGSEGRVMNNPYKIFNVAGNMRHPEWGDTDTGEWFGDRYWPGDRRLMGGRSGQGGFADVDYYSSNLQSDRVGFRPWITFSSKT